PLATFAPEVIVEVLQGASDKIAEAGANFVGGHSIDDDTLKFGLSVTGFVHPDRVWSNSKARTGDALILTKALGTGTCMAALKRQEFAEKDLQEPIESMMQLNRILDLLPDVQAQAIHAATDITGFGLLGHSQQMAQASQRTIVFEFGKLPVFAQAPVCLEKGFLTKAHRSNAAYTESSKLEGLTALQKLILHDPQTSGGLLLSVASELAPQILLNLQKRFPKAAIVGRVQAQQDCAVEVQA
ncbi:MAG: selenide, water dikinase SelD, partial [Bdellovibrionales bacterium]